LALAFVALRCFRFIEISFLRDAARLSLIYTRRARHQGFFGPLNTGMLRRGAARLSVNTNMPSVSLPQSRLMHMAAAPNERKNMHNPPPLSVARDVPELSWQ